ncbi:hypothetical protein QJQ45_010011 [Haematococcus lacustris]|nr:hypothetical protein QJQ45_010011 [Haematococcus lacustris]
MQANSTEHLPQALRAAFLLAVVLRAKACSERAVLGSLLLGFLVRDLFSLHVADVADQLDEHGQPMHTITDLSCRNLYLHLCRGLPGDGENRRPSAAVAAVLAAHPDLRAALNIRRCAVGPGPRPTELCYWEGRPAMPKPGQPGQDWVELPDKALLRKWRRK